MKSLVGLFLLTGFCLLSVTSSAQILDVRRAIKNKVVNKDVVKPESYGTLKGIADVLKENPDVRVKIVGHTDSDGADAANLDLSKRRGLSVKNELAKNFGIDASRLESDGLGESQPVAPNDTPVNKALNRRVEFIKL